MLCYQDNQFFSPALPCSGEKLREILDSPLVKWKIESIRSLRQPDANKVWGGQTEYQKFCIKEGAFDVEYFQESEWYRWEPTYHVKFLYVVIGILGPLGVKWLWDKGTSLIAQGFKNCDVSSAAEERYP